MATENEEKKQSDQDILQEAKDRAALCREHYFSEYKRGQDDIRFAMHGEQWDEEIKNKRMKEGRPCLTENRVHTSILQVINSIRQSRPAIQVNPVDDNSDVETARILKGVIRNIEQVSGADNVYDTAALNAITAGYGWIRVLTQYADDEGFDQEAKLVRVPDFSSVMLDPNSRELDGSDAEYGFIFTGIEHEAFEAQFPDSEPVTLDGYDANSGWADEKTVRIAEYFRRCYRTKTLVKTAQGAMPKEEADYLQLEVLQTREIQEPYIEWYKISGKEILEKTDWVGKYIPLVPVYGEEVIVDGERKYFSLVTHAKDPQRRYNYWLTASAEIIALQPKSPYVGVSGQFKSSGSKWARANNETFAYLEYDVVKTPSGQEIATPPQRQMPPTGSPAMFQEMMAAADGIKATLGIFDASLGAQGNEKSGKAILARQAQGDNSTFHFVDNLQTAIRHVGRILIDIIPKIYTGPRIMRIIGDDGSESRVPINQPVVKQGANAYAPVRLGEPAQAFFDLNVGKYDVVATVGPSYVSKRRETAEMLQSLMQAIPESAKLFGDIFVKNLDIPEAEIIVERMRRVNPIMQDDKNPLAEQLQQATAALQAAQAQTAQMEQALKAKREKDGAEVNAEIEKSNAEVKKIEAETAKIMADIAALNAQPGGLKMEHMAEVIRTIAQMEIELKDTADAVDAILSHTESQRATLPPNQEQMPQQENQNA